MKDYEGYINELKSYRAEPDFDRMTGRLQESITKESIRSAARWLKPLAAGALAACFLIIFASAYYFSASRHSDYFSEYIFNGNGSDTEWNFLKQ